MEACVGKSARMKVDKCKSMGVMLAYALTAFNWPDSDRPTPPSHFRIHQTSRRFLDYGLDLELFQELFLEFISGTRSMSNRTRPL
jgi:hypothetical protein